jgi:type III secretion system FlhB-like substrate exporter
MMLRPEYAPPTKPSWQVVVTDRGPLAVALEYVVDVMDCPLVVAKGLGAAARRIVDQAVSSGIPVVEAQFVWHLAALEIGDEIPEKTYQPVADLLVSLAPFPKDNPQGRLSQIGLLIVHPGSLEAECPGIVPNLRWRRPPIMTDLDGRLN